MNSRLVHIAMVAAALATLARAAEIERPTNQQLVRQQREEVEAPAEPFKHWTVVPMYSYGAFNNDRSAWQEELLQIFYQHNPQFMVGAEIDIMQRPPSGTDILYSGLVSWYPVKYLELHAKLSFCPDPHFAPNQIYNGGFEYWVAPRLVALFDYTQYNFSSVAPLGPGSIEQLRPGLSYYFNDNIWLTLRFAHGWAFGDQQYNYYGGTINIANMPGGGKLSAGFAYGTDPDIDFGTGDSSLSNAYIGTLFYQHPITKNFSIIAGAQYIYRLKQNNTGQLYQQWVPTIGAVWKF